MPWVHTRPALVMAQKYSARRDTTPSSPLKDRAAFARFYEGTHLAVYRYVFALTGGPASLVEDLTAETFFRAWRARHSFNGDETARMGWLLRIARNLVIDYHRQHSRRGPAGRFEDESLPGTDPGPESLIELADEQITLLRALKGLSERSREMLVLRYVLGWKVKEIAKHLDMFENTVSVSLRRSLERMRRDWPAQEYSVETGSERESDQQPKEISGQAGLNKDRLPAGPRRKPE